MGEETAAYGDIIYKSQQKRNIIQVFTIKKKILVLWSRQEDLLQSLLFHAG